MEDLKLGGLLSLSPEKFSGLLIRLLGPVLLVVLVMLVSLMTYTYFTEVLPHILPSIGVWSGMALTVLGLFLLFNIIFNYTYCVCKGPGHPPNNPDLPLCRVCKGPKPLRTHHCSVCNKCVMKMDHHCPWIMNCVGHLNHRYFVLFLVYLTLGCVFMTITSYTTFMSRAKSGLVHISFLLAAVFAIVMLFFTVWHTILVFLGCTTIELFGYYGESEDKEKFNFSRRSWRKNLETVFGTSSLFWALMPNRSDLPFDGVWWPDTLHSV